MNLGRQAVRGTTWVAGASWINRLVLVAVLAVLATRLEPGQFGLLTVAALVSNLLLVFNDVGLADALVYYQRRRVRQAAETTLLVATVVGAILAGLMLVVAPAAASFLHAPDATGILRAYAFVVWANAVHTAPMALLTHRLEFRRRFVPETLPGLIGGVLTIVLAYAGMGVWSLVVGDLVRVAVTLVVAFVVLGEPLSPRWHRREAGELWSYARGSLPSKVLDFALQNVDYLLVARLLGPIALGYYTLAFRLAVLPFLTITLVLIGIAFPTLSRLMPDVARARQALGTVLRLGMAAVGLFAGGLVALAPFLELLGSKWAPAVATSRFLALYIFLRSAAYLLTPLLNAVGRPGVVAALRAAWLALLTGLVLATARSIVAVAIVQALVAAGLFVAHAAAARRLTAVAVRDVMADVARPAVAGAVAAVLVVSLRDLGGLPSTSWSAALLLGVGFVGAYVTVLRALAPGLRDDVRQLRARAAGQVGVTSPLANTGSATT